MSDASASKHNSEINLYASQTAFEPSYLFVLCGQCPQVNLSHWWFATEEMLRVIHTAKQNMRRDWYGRPRASLGVTCTYFYAA